MPETQKYLSGITLENRKYVPEINMLNREPMLRLQKVRTRIARILIYVNTTIYEHKCPTQMQILELYKTYLQVKLVLSCLNRKYQPITTSTVQLIYIIIILCSLWTKLI